jgi:hypothetical protein
MLFLSIFEKKKKNYFLDHSWDMLEESEQLRFKLTEHFCQNKMELE